MKDKCDGCYTYEKNGHALCMCIIRKENQKSCPCQICLIKVVCRNACEELKQCIDPL